MDDFEGMQQINNRIQAEFVGYDLDLTMGEITVSPTEKATGLASITWASCVE